MQAIILGFIPLIIFAILDSVASLNIALIVTIIATCIEIIYTIYKFGTLDAVSIFSISLVFLLAFLAYKNQNRQLIKIKPGILKGSLGLYLTITYLFGHPLLVELMEKYPQFIPDAQRAFYQTPFGQQILSQLSIGLGLSFIIYGGIVAWAGLKLNNFWWTVVNIIGFFLSIFIPMIIIMLKLS